MLSFSGAGIQERESFKKLRGVKTEVVKMVCASVRVCLCVCVFFCVSPPHFVSDGGELLQEGRKTKIEMWMKRIFVNSSVISRNSAG